MTNLTCDPHMRQHYIMQIIILGGTGGKSPEQEAIGVLPLLFYQYTRSTRQEVVGNRGVCQRFRNEPLPVVMIF